jgi:SAM-dependent methyltransferase
MDHIDHVNLLKDGIPIPGGIWGEFGSGRGAFTLALAELVAEEGVIYSVDRDGYALNEQARVIQRRFLDQAPEMHYLTADYTNPLPLPVLDGLLLANALHFQRNKGETLELCLEHLRPGGCLILVEYNVDRGNSWVPYPVSYVSWQSLAQDCGYVNTRFLAARASRFLGEIYSAVSYKPVEEG